MVALEINMCPVQMTKETGKKLKTFRSEALNQTFSGSPPFLNML
jgi:hypothetical protein